jgi:hypothetical protein
VPLRDAITDLYDAWWDKRTPERTRAERAAAPGPPPRHRRQLVRRRRPQRRPARHPGYRPRTGYRPATGTGIAPDIRLPVRRYRKKGA